MQNLGKSTFASINTVTSKVIWLKQFDYVTVRDSAIQPRIINSQLPEFIPENTIKILKVPEIKNLTHGFYSELNSA